MPTHEEQIASEAAARYAALTRRIQALDTEIARTLDQEQLEVLQERRDEMSRQREKLVTTVSFSSDRLSDPEQGIDDTMERDDLKILYEMRGEMAALKVELSQVHTLVDQVRAECMPAGAGISPVMLNVMMIGGLVVLVLLITLTILTFQG